MKWVCTNCGNRFENDETGTRCPECLRRNGILLEEEEKTRKSGGSVGGAPRRSGPVLALAIGGATISIAIAMIVLLLSNRQERSSSKYAKAPDDFTTAAARAREAGGLELTAAEDPFRVPAEVGELAKKWGGDVTAVFAKLEEAAKTGVHLGVPSGPFLMPGDLAAALVKGQTPKATPLEWALLGHALAVRLNKPVAVALLRFPEGTAAHPWALGLYATALHGDGLEKPPTKVIPFGAPGTGADARVLSGAEVLAVVLSQAAIGRVMCVQRPLELLLPRDKPRAASDDDARFASQRLQAAAALAPELAVVKAAAVWGHVCLGMHRKARMQAEQLVSEHEMLRQKATGGPFSFELDARRLYGFSVLMQFVDGAPAGAAEALEKADPEFAPLAIPVAISTQNNDKLTTALASLPASELPELRYLKVVGALMRHNREAMQAALPDARALSAAIPDAKWALQLLFGLCTATDQFDEARALIPRIISGSPNAGEMTEELRRMIQMAEDRAKSDAEAAKAAAEAAATTGTPPAMQDPMK